MPFFWFLFVQTLRTLFVNRMTLWLGKTKLGIWLKNNFDIILNKIVKTKKNTWKQDIENRLKTLEEKVNGQDKGNS
tara:strand:+ start:365 stop:592 length:228 start_codon:yes stop_codon:yes gene_type:complete